MSENTKIWDILGRTDPAHVKRFKRAGGFEGTAIKPMWSYRRMTEEFGPCGQGWGIEAPQFQVLAGADDEKLVFCTVTVWYLHGEERYQLVGVGGDKAVAKNKYGLASDDEAFKKAFTDAVTNALKLLGVGADVHMGLFDDNKYVNAMKEEFAADHQSAEVVPMTPAKSSAQLKREVDWKEVEREVWECKTMLALDKMRQILRDRAVKEGWNQNFKYAAKELLDKQEADIREWEAVAGELRNQRDQIEDEPEIAQNYRAG